VESGVACRTEIFFFFFCVEYYLLSEFFLGDHETWERVIRSRHLVDSREG
jgi:hypothetical protein